MIPQGYNPRSMSLSRCCCNGWPETAECPRSPDPGEAKNPPKHLDPPNGCLLKLVPSIRSRGPWSGRFSGTRGVRNSAPCLQWNCWYLDAWMFHLCKLLLLVLALHGGPKTPCEPCREKREGQPADLTRHSRAREK